MIPCPPDRVQLDAVRAVYGNLKFYVYGFSAANSGTDDFFDAAGNIVIAGGSSMWNNNQPDDRQDRDRGLYTFWSKIVDTEDRYFSGDDKVCVCW